MSDISRRLEGLSEEQKSLLLLRLSHKKAGMSGVDKERQLRPMARGESIPLSFAQQRLWFIDQFSPQNAAYNVPGAVRLEGRLHKPALTHVLNQIVARHESLRTKFIEKNGTPYQEIAPELEITLLTVDLQSVPEGIRKQEIQRLIDEESRRPFDLASWPLFRASLLQLAESEYILLLNMHHIISDGWSLSIFFREIATFTQMLTAGQSAALPDLPIQYADFALWQRNWLQGDTLQKQLSYWQNQLTPLPAVLELQTDYLRPAVQSLNGEHQTQHLSLELSQALKKLSQDTNTTPFMLLLTAFKALLYRYTRQTDIVVGVPIAGRNQKETEELIGFFVNTLALRSDLAGNPRFQDLLFQVRDTTLAAYSHQELPFERLIEELEIDRDLSHSPLFQVMFALQNAPVYELKLSNFTLTPLPIKNTTSKFDLTLSLSDRAQGLTAVLEYNTDLFHAQSMARLLQHYTRLLEGIVADPKSRLNDLPLLQEEEAFQMRHEWAANPTSFTTQHHIYDLFLAQVAGAPDRVACSYQEEEITYKALNDKADRLAQIILELEGNGDDPK